MTERKRLTQITILDVLIDAEPYSVPEDTLSARCSLRPPQPSTSEIKDACEELEKAKAVSSDVNPVTNRRRFSTNANSSSYRRSLKD